MRRPVVGVIGNAYRIEDRFATQMVGERNLRAVAEVAGALPLMFAGAPDITDVGALLDAVDGVVLTGARANVHPARFGTEPDPRHEPYDINRDDLALALSEACVARGIPLFGICRGLQEMNVAFGGSLHPEIRELPGRMNHRMPRLENGEIHPDPDGRLRRPARRPSHPRRRLCPATRLRDHPRQFAARSGHPRTGQAGHRRGRGGGRHDRGDPDCRRAGLCARRAMACRIRSAAQSRSTAHCFRLSARRWWPASGPPDGSAQAALPPSPLSRRRLPAA